MWLIVSLSICPSRMSVSGRTLVHNLRAKIISVYHTYSYIQCTVVDRFRLHIQFIQLQQLIQSYNFVGSFDSMFGIGFGFGQYVCANGTTTIYVTHVRDRASPIFRKRTYMYTYVEMVGFGINDSNGKVQDFYYFFIFIP